MRTIKRVIVHCSDTPPTLDIGAKDIRLWHTAPKPKGNGWLDIGYHYVIRRDGIMEPGRPVAHAGAHVAGHNYDTIGVCLVGGKWEADYEPEQYDALAALIRSLFRRYGNLEVLGHRNLDPKKGCPRFDVRAWWESEKNKNP